MMALTKADKRVALMGVMSAERKAEKMVLKMADKKVA